MSVISYVEKTLERLGQDDIQAKEAECLAREAWEALVLLALYAGPRGGDKLVFKGGSLLRLIYGSKRMSVDLDFDEIDANSGAPEITTRKINEKLERAKGILYDMGFRDVSFHIAKQGEGTVRYKASATAPLISGGLRFNSKIEISRRQTKGLQAVAQKYGIDSIYTEMVPSVSPALAEELPKLQRTFIKVYTPLAMFLLKLNAIAAVERYSSRDIYDLAYIWRHLGVGDPEKRKFVLDCIKTFVDEEFDEQKKNNFLPLMKEKGERFASDLDQKTDLFFYGKKDNTELGIFVLDFAEEFEDIITKTPDTGLTR